MTGNYYIMSNGILKRKENTIYFINKEVKRALPLTQIKTIFLFGNVTVSSQAVKFLAMNHIPIHIFNKYGFYVGTYYPREKYLSGRLLVKQAEHYLDGEKRLYLAKEFVKGAALNIVQNCYRFKIHEETEEINKLVEELKTAEKITEVMNIEARIREEYYKGIDKVMPEEFKFVKRTRQPPKNRLNALISLGNSILYTTVLSEIYLTQLNPTISYLHEPFERRFSLSLDLAEIFKPIIVDRLIFALVRQRIIQAKHFDLDLNSCLLSKEGKRIFVSHYDKKLKTTIKHKKLGRSVSYRRLIRLEAYKLIKHLLGIKRYKSFVAWW
ncbi:MAG: subtype I-B CRISPR-associated endonuclease Cas1 [Thermoprotei archaeon]|nr:MAG: subtype I-B CRISPR-associated endonuclease Cas1 [Thermoprotei archaeon]